MQDPFKSRYRGVGAAALGLIAGLAGGWQLRSSAVGAEENAATVAAAEIDRFY